MKNVVLALAALSVSIGLPSYAKEKKVVTTPTTHTSDDTSSSAPSSTWLGVSSDTSLTGTNGLPVSALLAFSDKTALQLYLAVAGTKPNFGFGLGGNLKFNVIGNAAQGFHLGGGVGLGTSQQTGTFFVNIAGGLGLHFTVADNVMFVADAGLRVHIQTGATDFSIGSNGILGGSVLFHL